MNDSKKTESLLVRISPEMKAKLYARAAYLDVSASDIVRDAIEDLPDVGKVLTIDEIKDLCETFFREQPYFKRVWLFGSYARGEADERSDVDLAYEADRDWKGRFASAEQCGCWLSINELFMRAGVAEGVDLICAPGTRFKRFHDNFERDRILVYEKHQ